MSSLHQQYFQVYVFEPVADIPAPKGGQIVCVTQTPDFGQAHILLITDGSKTIRQLYTDWKNNRASSQELMAAIITEQQARIAAITAEQQARINADNTERTARETAITAERAAREAADTSLQHQITALQQAANRALVFDNHAALETWMASGQSLPTPNPPYKPSDLQVGWLSLFRSTGEADQWWDGERWLDQEIHLDLGGYRTAEEQDVIDAELAPLLSPKFRGIPEVPTPDYTVPQQAVPVSELAYLAQIVRDLLAGVRRRYRKCEITKPIERYRQYEKGLVMRMAERDIEARIMCWEDIDHCRKRGRREKRP